MFKVISALLSLTVLASCQKENSDDINIKETLFILDGRNYVIPNTYVGLGRKPREAERVHVYFTMPSLLGAFNENGKRDVADPNSVYLILHSTPLYPLIIMTPIKSTQISSGKKV